MLAAKTNNAAQNIVTCSIALKIWCVNVFIHQI